MLATNCTVETQYSSNNSIANGGVCQLEPLRVDVPMHLGLRQPFTAEYRGKNTSISCHNIQAANFVQSQYLPRALLSRS